MSLYGTQILLTGADASSSASGGQFVKGSEQKTDKDLAPISTFQNVVYGAKTDTPLTQYRCKDFNPAKADSCQQVSTADSTFPGTYRYILTMLIGKQTMDKLSCALLRKEADKPLHFIADDVDTTHLGHDPVFLKLKTRIAEQLEMFSIIKLKAIIMQPLRISFISIRQYLIYDRRLFILIVYW